MNIRHVRSEDYDVIYPQLNEWWGGRNMADMLPRLFIEHFTNTSFVIEKDGQMIAFLIGFLSQTNSNEAYIHFVGVHPNYRRNQLGKLLYERFFEVVKTMGRDTIRCVTSPVNKRSVAYHTSLGFAVEKGDTEIDGISVFSNYDGKNQARVAFVKKLD